MRNLRLGWPPGRAVDKASRERQTPKAKSLSNEIAQILSNITFQSEQFTPSRVTLKSAVVIVAGVCLLAPNYSYAKKKSSANLEAEVERLKKELEGSKKESEQAKLEREQIKRENERLKKAVAAAPQQAVETPVAENTPQPEAPAEATQVLAQETGHIVKEDIQPDNLAEVVVTARRKEEKLQDVPIPVSVVSGELTRRDNISTLKDFARRVPNLSVSSPQPRATSLALRGLGRSNSNDALEASVGVMVDNVFYAWTGAAFNDYTDIDHIEVLRGPQGTLQGKNSNLGLVNISSRMPSFTPSYYVDGFAGNRDSLQGKAAATGPIIDGLLAYRFSLNVNKLNGQVHNNDFPVGPLNLADSFEMGGRFQALLTPTDNLTSRLIVTRSSARQTMTVQPNIADPKYFKDGTLRPTTLTSRLSRDWFNDYRNYQPAPLLQVGDPRNQSYDNHPTGLFEQQGVSNEVNWKVPGHKLTSISAYSYAMYQGRHDYDYSLADVGRKTGGGANNRQWSQEFRVTSEKPAFDFIDYQAGIYALRSKTISNTQHTYGNDAGAFYATNSQYKLLNASLLGRDVMRQSLNRLTNTAITSPNLTSLAGFGQVNLHVTDKADLTLGLRHTYEQRDNQASNKNTGGSDLSKIAGATAQQIAAGNAIRKAFVREDWIADRQGFSETSQNWLVTPSYKFTKNLMTYFTVGGGKKSGAAQFSNDGKAENVDPENIMDYELGVKTAWLDGKLTANLNLYQSDVEGYQAPLNVSDPTSVTGFRNTLGNIKGIQLRGVELDSAWNAYQGLSLFLNGSFSHAVYTDFKNAPCPSELNTPTKNCDQTGLTLPSAPQFTANYGVDYRVPLGFGKWEDFGLEWHAFLVDSFKSKANVDGSLSQTAGIQPAYHVTDGGIGVATKSGQYNLDLVSRNLFDTIYQTSSNGYTSSAAAKSTFGEGRYYGVHFRANF